MSENVENPRAAAPGQEVPDISLSEAVYHLAVHFMAAVRNSILYSPAHSQVRSALLLTLQKARRAFRDTDEITFICIEKELVFGGRPMNKKGLHFEKMAQFMNKVGIKRLTFLAGLSLDELEKFLADLSAMTSSGEEGGGDGRIHSSAHIKLGRQKTVLAAGELSREDLQRLMSGGQEGEEPFAGRKRPGGDYADEASAEHLRQAREAVATLFSRELSLTFTDADPVSHFVEHFLQYAEDFFSLDQLKTHDELTFKHSLNVALLCAAQAQTLGIPSELFADVTLCGLLHDVGKVYVSPDVLNKPGRPSREEALALAAHPRYGAAMLAGNPRIPRLVLAAVWEHHMHWDGRGGYPKSPRVDRPHPVSQMVMLADFFDAARTEKPYRKAQSLEYVVAAMESRRGAQFHPALVRNFLEMLQAMELTGKSLPWA
ncbi:MAG: HD domain-containing protein [Deltaproteobacteria bacterium]|nr:HD domain-containing protein [Deltaproteobacteria bacterium]